MQNLAPTVLYEDDTILAINKPAGLMVHGDGKSSEYTVADWMLEHYPETKHVGEPMVIITKTDARLPQTVILRPGIVHRLDKETSGVMLLAKTQQAFAHLKQQFQDRTVEKVYHAFLYSNVREDVLVVDAPIGRSSKDVRRWTAGKDARGELRYAVTEFKTLMRGMTEGEHVTLVEARPKTGRTHQIRVHAKLIDKPIVADSLYAPGRPSLLGFSRLALHAQRITFTRPDGARVVVEAPYPEDFAAAVAAFAPVV
ncbi:MAG: ribosomal large subunit pseudouridine synthase rRNA synthase [Candidatus Parcubacteria bacterium]|jgi:23S rRNA pseudouridine1911/1915/1917 synthase